MRRTLSPVGHAEVSQAKFLDIFLQSDTLGTRIGFSDKRRERRVIFARSSAKPLLEEN